jgi:hypothetical protein
MNKLTLAFAASAIIIASGCATMSHGSRQSIQIDSDPSGASFMVDGDPVPYTTPATIELVRGQDHTIAFRRDGYDDYTANLSHSTSGAVLGNALAGGLIGVGIDYSSGAAYQLENADLTDDVLKVTLKPKAVTAEPKSAAVSGTAESSLAGAETKVETAAAGARGGIDSAVTPLTNGHVTDGLQSTALSAPPIAQSGEAGAGGGSK